MSTSESEKTPPARIGGLDGIRALAALAVLIYHAFPALMPGGFFGVDVFFVLSGFLITSILIKNLDSKTFSLPSFWLRRWRRLFPAVAATVVVTTPLAALISSDLVANLRVQLAGAFTFSYNWVTLASGASYFDRVSPKLYTNMWTLAVEQQFYLVWPLLVLLLWKFSTKVRTLVTLCFAALSVAVMAVFAHGADDVSRAYMGTDSHAFGLMIGAALAFACARPALNTFFAYSGRVRHCVGLAGFCSLGGLIACFLLLSDTQNFIYPWLTLVPVVCTTMIIFAMTAPVQNRFSLATFLRLILDARPLVWLGERSYGIYLWHWPLLVIWWYAYPLAPSWLTVCVNTLLSIVCAAMSFRFIENPMRYGGIISTLRTWIHTLRPHAIIPLAVILLLGVVVPTVYAPRYSQVEQALGLGAPSDSSPSSSAHAEQTSAGGDAAASAPPAQPAEPQTLIENKPEAAISGENILVVGDSVVKALETGLQERWPGVVVDGAVSRSYYAILPLLDAYNSQGLTRHYVIVGAANNGAIPPEVIEQWLAALGPERVLILITGHGNDRTSWIQESNATIAQARAQHPDRIIVADWFAAADAHPEWLYQDLTHPNPEGIAPFLDILTQALTEGSTLDISMHEVPAP